MSKKRAWKRKRRSPIVTDGQVKRRAKHKSKYSAACKNFKEKAGFTNRHHLLPRARGGSWEQSNILVMDKRKHDALHLIFKLKTFPEIARMLMFTWNLKKYGSTRRPTFEELAADLGYGDVVEKHKQQLSFEEV